MSQQEAEFSVRAAYMPETGEGVVVMNFGIEGPMRPLNFTIEGAEAVARAILTCAADARRREAARARGQPLPPSNARRRVR